MLSFPIPISSILPLWSFPIYPFCHDPNMDKPLSSPLNSIALTTTNKHISTYPQKSSSYELPGPPTPQPTTFLPRWRDFLLHTAHQQGSEVSRLPQVRLKEAQPHFSCVHWFHCFPSVAQLSGYQNFRQFSGFLLRLSQHTEFVRQSKPNLTPKAHWLHSSP